MIDDENKNENIPQEKLSLNDDRRVKTLSPGMLVLKRFVRNKVAVVGLIILIGMFLFSYAGALISPYRQDQTFTETQPIRQPIGGAKELSDYSFVKESGSIPSAVSIAARRAILSTTPQTEFTAKVNNENVTYTIVATGDFYEIYNSDDEYEFMAFKNSISLMNSSNTMSYDFKRQSLKNYELAFAENTTKTYTADSITYTVDHLGNIFKDSVEYAYVLSYSINPIESDVFFSLPFKQAVIETIETGKMLEGNEKEFSITENGEEKIYFLIFDAAKSTWDIKEFRQTTVLALYNSPSSKHLLGTEGHGMDMLTRLMYGGRVSLIIGFIVIIIETVIGVIFGGISGFFGGWVDNLIMRIVDVFYCIPTTPILITIGATMDAMRVSPSMRMVILMALMGFFGWAATARLVRGQILSLREQEFMTATEACGLSARRRIFKHLIPNVIPQLIVSCTMGLGSTILIEATLSFLGLGVKFPFASWGNIINDVNDIYVLTNYLFVWIPAGICIVLTVLAFNLVGDGLRDAFDPKMKR